MWLYKLWKLHKDIIDNKISYAKELKESSEADTTVKRYLKILKGALPEVKALKTL